MNDSLVFEGEGSEVRVRGKVASLPGLPQKTEEQLGMAWSWVHRTNGAPGEPGLDMGGGSINGHGILKDLAAGP
jgi:hypothetical protein